MRRLLLVEDDPIIANIYQRKFTEDGFTVAHAASGQAALAELDSVPPDIMILDIMLPIVNGLEVLRHIRADPALEKLPVVVFFNAYQPKIIEEAWAAGAAAVLMKANTNPMKLAATVADLLERQSAAEPAALPSELPLKPTVGQGPREDFLAELTAFVAGFKEVHHTLLSTTDTKERLDSLRELSRLANGLAGTAGAVGCATIARFAAAYQAFFHELHDHPARITASAVRTSVQAFELLELLEQLARSAGDLPDLSGFDPRVLIVEDDDISLRAAEHSLALANLTAVTEKHGETALNTAAREKFDLFLLDIDIIGMSGLELGSRLRDMPQYAAAPIIFVTAQQDFAGRLQSDLGGTTDIISKPYAFVELSLKSVLHLLRARLAESSLL
jgi:CheY-like chemotaxis protein